MTTHIVPQTPTRITLADLVSQLAALDDSLTQEFDPAILVEDIRNKVDDIKFIVDRLGAFDQAIKAQIEPLARARASANRNLESLKRYVAQSMQDNHFERLPGNTWRIQLQDNPGMVEFTREPSMEDAHNFPGVVEVVTQYRWRVGVIKEMLQEGGEFTFAKLKKGKHCRFYLNTEAKKVGDGK